MSPESSLRPGMFVKVAITHASQFAGRTGLLQALDGDVARVRFSAKRTFPFELRDLRRVVGGVR
jgi:hypothetical protein